MDQSELSFSSAFRSVEQDIRENDPSVIVGVSEDYRRYMSSKFILDYGNRYVRITINGLPYNTAIAETLYSVLDSNRITGKPVYLLYDDTRYSSALASAFSETLTEHKMSVTMVDIKDVSSLRNELIKLNSSDVGILVNLLGVIQDREFKTKWFHEETSKFIADNNTKHLDIGLSGADHNLALILGVDVTSIDDKAKPIAITAKPTLVVNTSRLRALGLAYIYSNSFSIISGVSSR
jgi:hypothetical protein